MFAHSNQMRSERALPIWELPLLLGGFLVPLGDTERGNAIVVPQGCRSGQGGPLESHPKRGTCKGRGPRSRHPGFVSLPWPAGLRRRSSSFNPSPFIHHASARHCSAFARALAHRKNNCRGELSSTSTVPSCSICVFSSPSMLGPFFFY